MSVKPVREESKYVLIYIFLNVGYFIYLQEILITQKCVFCPIRDLFVFLPVIGTPYDQLIEMGNEFRANLIAEFYSFNWISFIVISLFIFARGDFKNLDNYSYRVEVASKEFEKAKYKNKKGIKFVIVLLGAFILFESIIGSHNDFRVVANHVVSRDIDLFRIVLIFSLILFFVPLLMRCWLYWRSNYGVTHDD